MGVFEFFWGVVRFDLVFGGGRVTLWQCGNFVECACGWVGDLVFLRRGEVFQRLGLSRARFTAAS